MAESLGITQQTATADNLFSGDKPAPERAITLAAGQGAMVRGTVLGKITKGAVTIAATAGNTGTGAAGTITRGAKAKVGAYTLICKTAASNSGVFHVIDPNGYRLSDLTVAVAYDNGHFAVTIADATDFVVGDSFTVTVAAGSGSFKAYSDAATDGTDVACAILGRAIDATNAAKAFAYVGGEFNSASLTGLDAAGQADLEDRGFLVKTNFGG